MMRSRVWIVLKCSSPPGPSLMDLADAAAAQFPQGFEDLQLAITRYGLVQFALLGPAARCHLT